MSETFYEYRRYTAVPGKMPALLERFEKHTSKYLARHGVRVLAYWVGLTGANNVLHYIVEWSSMDEFDRNWRAFRTDAEYAALRAKTEVDGPLVDIVQSDFWRLTSFSPPIHAGSPPGG